MPFARHRLLLVEDEVDSRRILAALLQTTFDIVEAADGADAITKLEGADFAAVLTDLAMPVVDGVMLVGWIEVHRPKLLPCTFVVTAGPTDARLKQWLQTFDAGRVFDKPIDPAAVVVRIYAAIEIARKPREP
jgi:CheY-like chemotaxis protein